MNFNELIKTKRKEKELTQETLAEMIGTTKQTIANWENDRSKPQLTDDEMIDNIAKALDISKKEIIESITGLNNTSENYNKETINYPFLPDELMNLKLSEKEIEILFAMEYLEKNLAIDNFNDKYKKYGDYLCESTSSSSGEYYKQKLTYNDYVKILGSGRNVLSIKKYIDNILKVIDLNILLDIIRKNNLTTFKVQELSKKDVFKLLKGIPNFKQDFANVCNYLNKNIVFLSEPYDYEGKRYFNPSVTQTTRFTDEKSIILNSSYDKKSGHQYKKCKYIIENYNYFTNLEANYFSFIEIITEKEQETYNIKINLYNEELSSWNKKMEQIQEWRNVYGNDDERFSDIPKPQEPELPQKKNQIVLNYKGLLLKEFLEEMEITEESDFVKNARIELAPYLNKEISVFGTLTAIENNGYLFKSLYIDGKVIDHLWVYDIKEDLTIGNTYEIKGIAEIYTKEVEGKDMKNYGIKVNEINNI